LNATYRFANKIMYKTIQAKAWEQEAGWLIKKEIKANAPLSGPLNVSLVLHLKRDRDIDSSQKLLFDVLEKMGVMVNDKQIEELQVFKFKDKDNPRLEVTVTKLD
jgi:Holliday junction resolvase RusA-like endonuclease